MRFAALMCLALLLLGCGGGSHSTPVPVRTAPVKRGKMGTLLVTTGTVKARRRAALAAPEGGMVIRVEVSEGDRVTQGRPLIILNRQSRKTRIEVQQARVQQAQARLAQVQLQLHSAQTQRKHKLNQSRQTALQASISTDESRRSLDAAYRDWQRKNQLLKEKSIAKVEVEQAELQWKIKRDELHLAQSREKAARLQIQGVHDTDQDLRSQAEQINEAEGALQEANANLDEAQREERETVVRAPITGIVTNLKVVAGQSVGAELLGQVVDTENLEVISTLDPAQVTELDPATPTTLHSPLLKSVGQQLRFVEVIPEVEGKGNTIRARFKFVGKADKRLVDGLQVQVHLQMPEKTGWLLPRDALSDDRAKRSQIRVVRNHQEVMLSVAVLVRNETHALCEGQLNEGDEVVLAGDVGLGTPVVQVTPSP